MNMARCENGHFYDAERFESCPYCNQTTIDTKTSAITNTAVLDSNGSGLSDVINQAKDLSGGSKTVGYFGSMSTEPVVGWLVAISGNHFGEDFKLKSGRNFIGRGRDMDVSLAEDASVSRNRHAIVLYEPRGNRYLVQPGDAKELCYLNDEVVLTARELEANDVLLLGETKLMFIPCCSDKFNWDEAKKAEKAE